MDLKRIRMGLRIHCSASGQGQVVGCFEDGNEIAKVLKMWDLLD